MSLRIGYGVLTCQRLAGSDRTFEDIYADELSYAVAAEELGFDSVWLSEHHFTEDGYLSAIFPMMAAIAARTSRVDLGTDVILSPMHHPLRFAEDAAAVAVLAGAHRTLQLGLAIGYRDEEFQAWGVPKSERVARLVEHVEVARKAWTGERFSHRGPTLEVKDLMVRPAPGRPPQLWIGGWVDGAIRRAARLGDGYVSPSTGVRDTARRVAVLDEEAARVGRAEPVAVSTFTWSAFDDGAGISAGVLAGVGHLHEGYREWYSSSSDWGGGREFGEKLASFSDGTGWIQSGTSEQLLDRLGTMATTFARSRPFELGVRLHYPGMERAEVLDAMARFAAEVMTPLRSLVA